MTTPKKTTPKKIHVKKNDTVLIISGKDKGKKGKVLTAFPKDGKILVENVNIVTRHMKPKGAGQPGGKIHSEAAIYASKAMLFCTKCERATRISHKILEDGNKVRVCKKCDELFAK